ncbi:hypothetical protein QCA50_005565 [Cerrena zonata]|uniref:Uncharacterized protein n=1 Tax=Cerrena zonata TaxID=2478898 RepID=A0AAW0GFJ7_9APHY
MDSEDERECKLTQGTLASRLCDRDFLELRFFERNEVKAANGLHSDDATCHKIARYRPVTVPCKFRGVSHWSFGSFWSPQSTMSIIA